MEKKTIDKLIDKYEYALRQAIPLTPEQVLYVDIVLADMLSETFKIVTEDLQQIVCDAVVEQ